MAAVGEEEMGEGKWPMSLLGLTCACAYTRRIPNGRIEHLRQRFRHPVGVAFRVYRGLGFIRDLGGFARMANGDPSR
jgi:hypothetical protein